ncbi:MAG: hypothetical protein AABZ08_11730 [Planctomycetota bacterium]
MAAQLPTPIPVGSPFVADPPTFDRWGLGFSKSHRVDQRDYSRVAIMRDIWLMDRQTNSVLRCRTNDISDAGLHASAPIGFGLAVGQRYEMRVGNDDAPRGISAVMAKSLGYGTVIRTEMHVGGDLDRIGFAIRFDVPQLIDV